MHLSGWRCLAALMDTRENPVLSVKTLWQLRISFVLARVCHRLVLGDGEFLEQRAQSSYLLIVLLFQMSKIKLYSLDLSFFEILAVTDLLACSAIVEMHVGSTFVQVLAARRKLPRDSGGLVKVLHLNFLIDGGSREEHPGGSTLVLARTFGFGDQRRTQQSLATEELRCRGETRKRAVEGIVVRFPHIDVKAGCVDDSRIAEVL